MLDELSWLSISQLRKVVRSKMSHSTTEDGGKQKHVHAVILKRGGGGPFGLGEEFHPVEQYDLTVHIFRVR